MDHKSHKGFPPRLFHFFAVAAVYLSSSFLAQAASTTLMWDPSPGADVAGYKLHYGTSSGRYDKVLDVRKTTQATVSDLTPDATYYFAVTAYNSTGVESVRSNQVSTKVAPQPNQNPVISLTSPSQGSSVVRGSQVSIAATASDPDGTVAKVAFFASGSKIGEDTSAPYTVTWTPSKAGNYNLVARVTDDRGAEVSSQTVTIQVTNGNNGGGGGSGKPPKGKFTALLDSAGGSSPYTGAVTLSTNLNGTYSGVVKYEGKSYQVKGRLDADGRATKKIVRKGQPNLMLNIEASDANGGELSGSISDGTTEVDFSADRTAGKSEQATRSAGSWTLLLPPVEPTTGSNSYPQGTGFAKLEVNKKGVARLTGKLSDGSPIAQGGQILEDGKYLVYVPLYGRKGLLAGEVQFPTSDSAPKLLSGKVQWYKPATAGKKKYYSEGFDLTLDVIGEITSKQGGGNSGEDPRAGAAMDLTIFGGELTGTITKRITFNKNGRPQAIPGEERVKFELRKNGKFLGSFRDAATAKRRSFSGFFLSTQSVGAGYFLGKDETGGVMLESAD